MGDIAVALKTQYRSQRDKFCQCRLRCFLRVDPCALYDFGEVKKATEEAILV